MSEVDLGRPGGLSPQATEPKVSALRASIPDATGLRFCRDCAYIDAGPIGKVGAPFCHHPQAYQGGDFDLVTGHDGREFVGCAAMRLTMPGRCGREGELFLHRALRQARQVAAQGIEARSGKTAKQA